MALPSGIVLDGEGIIGWPTMLFSRSLKCDRWSLKLAMTWLAMNSLVLFLRMEKTPWCIKEGVKRCGPPVTFKFIYSYTVVDFCYWCHLSSLRYNDLRYHVAMIHIRC